MKKIVKSIIISNKYDYAITKHYIKRLNLQNNCGFRDPNIIDFFDNDTYQTVKKFTVKTKIYIKINTKKDKQ